MNKVGIFIKMRIEEIIEFVKKEIKLSLARLKKLALSCEDIDTMRAKLREIEENLSAQHEFLIIAQDTLREDDDCGIVGELLRSRWVAM